VTDILAVPERVLAAERRREFRQLLERSSLGTTGGYGARCRPPSWTRRPRHDRCRRRDCPCLCHELTGMPQEQADWEADE
jgi:hypothetical protein